jgi:hypothetical protein
MPPFNLDQKRFSPVRNSEGGRVKSDSIFAFEQTGKRFQATYWGEGFSDGHLIGIMTSKTEADLIYHCRENATDHLEAGQAKAVFSHTDDGKVLITMNWAWLNGSLASGTSVYEEIL